MPEGTEEAGLSRRRREKDGGGLRATEEVREEVSRRPERDGGCRIGTEEA